MNSERDAIFHPGKQPDLVRTKENELYHLFSGQIEFGKKPLKDCLELSKDMRDVFAL